jgi:signal transduction histidine kinase
MVTDLLDLDRISRGMVAPELRPLNLGRAVAGVGVGLALVARFAELQGGRAWVEDGEHGGASFRVWLPARSRPS